MIRSFVLICFVIGVCFFVSPAWADNVHELSCSTSGPVPPKGVLPAKAVYDRQAIVDETEIEIDSYIWRHGCGPTAVGMVIGYWDSNGFPLLITGDASTQTEAVNQAIASGGEMDDPNAAGSEGNCEDYCIPQDDRPGDPLRADDYITDGRAAHADNCIADWMFTSQSTRVCGTTLGMRYGWSCSGDICGAYDSYVDSRSEGYTPDSQRYFWGLDDFDGDDGDDNWDLLKAEIDAERPMIFLVDFGGDGSTDHFVTIIGYRLNDGNREYGCKDTWAAVTRWERFRVISAGDPWGIHTAYTFSLEKSAGADGEWWVDKAYGGVEVGTLAQPFNMLGEAVTAAAAGDRIFIKGGNWDDEIEITKAVYLDFY
ncbi:hypothetical protein KAI46_07055 [bacterium]|nr:hypothetical protein [bacterium]